jgi:hypothetical protein
LWPTASTFTGSKASLPGGSDGQQGGVLLSQVNIDERYVVHYLTLAIKLQFKSAETAILKHLAAKKNIANCFAYLEG